MTFTQHYDSPLGGILLAADEIGLTGLWFDGEKYFADNLPIEHTELETPILAEAKQWLDSSNVLTMSLDFGFALMSIRTATQTILEWSI